MIKTLERTVCSVNDTITDGLDGLESNLPPIPSKALAATRASARRVNDVVEAVVTSLRSRVETVSDDVSTASATTRGQARSAARRSASTIERGVKQTTGQARAAVDRTTDAVSRGAKETVGQARSNVERSAAAVRRGVAETTGQASAQAGRVKDSLENEVEGALDDAKVATDPDDLAAWSKAELYERAQGLDIDGRSTMSKAELVGAIQKA